MNRMSTLVAAAKVDDKSVSNSFGYQSPSITTPLKSLYFAILSPFLYIYRQYLHEPGAEVSKHIDSYWEDISAYRMQRNKIASTNSPEQNYQHKITTTNSRQKHCYNTITSTTKTPPVQLHNA